MPNVVKCGSCGAPLKDFMTECPICDPVCANCGEKYWKHLKLPVNLAGAAICPTALFRFKGNQDETPF